MSQRIILYNPEYDLVVTFEELPDGGAIVTHEDGDAIKSNSTNIDKWIKNGWVIRSEDTI